MDVGTLEQWLWEAACGIRGPLDAPKFKDYILPLVFLKRLSDVFDDEVARLADELGSEEIGVEPKEIHLRPRKRRWASASSAGRLTFDTSLLTEPPEKRAEVIVHLKVGNHGPLFRNLVRAHLANSADPKG